MNGVLSGNIPPEKIQFFFQALRPPVELSIIFLHYSKTSTLTQLISALFELKDTLRCGCEYIYIYIHIYSNKGSTLCN